MNWRSPGNHGIEAAAPLLVSCIAALMMGFEDEATPHGRWCCPSD
jgi:hypothetical protein